MASSQRSETTPGRKSGRFQVLSESEKIPTHTNVISGSFLSVSISFFFLLAMWSSFKSFIPPEIT